MTGDDFKEPLEGLVNLARDLPSIIGCVFGAGVFLACVGAGFLWWMLTR